MFCRQLHLAFLFLLLFAACQSSNDTSSTAAPEPENTTFWQLADDSELRITLSPWPLKADVPVKLSVEASTGDWTDEDKSLVDKTSYAVSSGTEKPASLTSMKMVRVDSDGNKFFEAETTFPRGTSYLHVRAEGSGYTGGSAGELEPWKIEVK